MTAIGRARGKQSAGWLILAIAAVAVIFFRLQLSFDLSAFLPSNASIGHEVLIEQLRNGPGSRVLVIGLQGDDPQQLADASDDLRAALTSLDAFSSVSNGEFDEGSATPPAPIADYYLLQRDLDYSRAALDAAIKERLQDLAFGGGSSLLALLARDPYLVTLEILERLVPVTQTGELWFAEDGSAVLVAETRAPPTEIDLQEQALAAIQTAFVALPDSDALTLDVTGVGAFSVELQNTIRAEAAKRSFYASAALLLVLLLVFRRPRLLLLAAAPIGMGFICGLAFIALLFDKVHGITLACGFTLLGVAVDYPLHLFSHAQGVNGRVAIRRIWPTLRLGVVSTAIVYLGLAFSGSEGLAQLGIFTACGVLVAVLVTRFWLPWFLPGSATAAAEEPVTVPRLHFAAGLLLLALVALPLASSVREGIWNDRLSSLSPVAAERLAADARLRAATGAVDLRYQAVLHADTLEALLQADEAAGVQFAAAAEAGLLDSWQSVSQLLPSAASQQQRRDAIPGPDALASELQSVLDDTVFQADAFAPFLDAAAHARSLPDLTPEAIAKTPFASWLEAHLLHVSGRWVSLIHLTSPQPQALAERFSAAGSDIGIVDLQAESVALMRDYRLAAGKTVAVAALLVLLLLWFAQRRFRRLAWIALTVTAALATTVALVSTLQGGLTVIHIVGLLLVLGLGLDYALFMSRAETSAERAASRRGVFACAASTTLAFGILAASSIPVLQFLGLTVAVGSASSYLLAWLGSSRFVFRRKRRTRPGEAR